MFEQSNRGLNSYPSKWRNDTHIINNNMSQLKNRLSRDEMKSFLAGGLETSSCSNRGEACNSDLGLKCCSDRNLVCAEFKCQWETIIIE